MADCPICSKGTVLDQTPRPARRKSRSGPTSDRTDKRSAGAFSGPHVSAGPFTDAAGVRYTVRLERVPGGVRLAEWAGSALRPRAPVLAAGDLVALVGAAAEALAPRDAAAIAAALAAQPPQPPEPSESTAGVSRGRAGDFPEELRVEAVGEGCLRVARWVRRPGAGWALQDAPPMLPARRYAEALAHAVSLGLIAAGSTQASPAAL